ncbi:MAG: glycosyltransferase family 4 protein [Candidatus Paceibacterota bacterium]
MRIGLISFHSFSRPGGVKRHIFGLHDEFLKIGVKSKIIAPRRKIPENYGEDVLLLGTSIPIDFNGSQADLNINFNPLAIEGVIQDEGFDVLHLHNFGFPSALQILTSPSASKTLNILTLHSDMKGSKFLNNVPTLLYFFNKIAQWKIDGIIGVSPLCLKTFKKYKGPKVVIPNGIDLEKFNPDVPPIKKYSDGKINILFLGRIEERKGLIYLLKAYKILEKKFSNLRLIIVGKGPLKEEMELWVKDNNLNNVVFEGEAKEEKIPSYYKTCDIYVSPAIFGESFGIVLLEAMALGKPVVAFANSGYRAVLKGRGAKFLVRPKNFRGLAEKIGLLIKKPLLREKMGEWGKEEVKKYSWPKISKQVFDFYKLCLDKKSDRLRGKNETVDKLLEKWYKKIVPT